MGVVRSRQQSGSRAPNPAPTSAPPTPTPTPGTRAPIVGGPGQVFVVSNQPMGRASLPSIPLPPQGMVSLAPQQPLMQRPAGNHQPQQPQQQQQQQQQGSNLGIRSVFGNQQNS